MLFFPYAYLGILFSQYPSLSDLSWSLDLFCGSHPGSQCRLWSQTTRIWAYLLLNHGSLEFPSLHQGANGSTMKSSLDLLSKDRKKAGVVAGECSGWPAIVWFHFASLLLDFHRLSSVSLFLTQYLFFLAGSNRSCFPKLIVLLSPMFSLSPVCLLFAFSAELIFLS